MKKSTVKMYVEKGIQATIKDREKTIKELEKSKNKYKEQLIELYRNAMLDGKKDLEEVIENFTIEED